MARDLNGIGDEYSSAIPRPSGSAAAISPSASGSTPTVGPAATTRSSRKAQEDRTGITRFLLIGKRRGLGIRKYRRGRLVIANGHVSRFLEELFPDADLREFQGTLTVTAEGGYYCGDRDSDRVQGGVVRGFACGRVEVMRHCLSSFNP